MIDRVQARSMADLFIKSWPEFERYMRALGWRLVDETTFTTRQRFDDWMWREERRLQGESVDDRWVKRSRP